VDLGKGTGSGGNRAKETSGTGPREQVGQGQTDTVRLGQGDWPMGEQANYRSAGVVGLSQRQVGTRAGQEEQETGPGG
jgi:hypothetical protein